MSTITITVSAENVPEGYKVHKPTGSKLYTMRRNGIKVWADKADGDTNRLQVFGAGVLHLQGVEHIQMISPETRLSIDFWHVEDASAFLEDLNYDHQTN